MREESHVPRYPLLAAIVPQHPPEVAITDVSQLPNFDPPLTSRAAAEVLGIDPSTLKKMRQRKQGPEYEKFESGTVRYRLSAVLRYLQARTVHH